MRELYVCVNARARVPVVVCLVFAGNIILHINIQLKYV